MVFSSTCPSTRMPANSKPIPSSPVQKIVNPDRQNGSPLPPRGGGGGEAAPGGRSSGGGGGRVGNPGWVLFPGWSPGIGGVAAPAATKESIPRAVEPQRSSATARQNRLARKPSGGIRTNT